MRKGTFNKIIRVGNIVFKLSLEHSSVAKEMLKLHSKNIKQYEGDIRDVGIKTSKVYFAYSIDDKNLIVQEFINGMTIQEYFDSDNVSSSDKLKVFKKVVEMYKLSLSNENLCLDWNLNNFVLNNNDIYYVDYVPALYKDKIQSINSNRLKQYQLSLLDKKIQMAGIISYAIMPFFNESKDNLYSIYNMMKQIIGEMLQVHFDRDDIEHVYLQKLSLLEKYLTSDMEKDDFLNEYNSISMSKTAYKKVRE